MTKIFLHNWHRFVDCEIDVEESLYLAGHNGSGKSTVLDALQLVMMADLSRVRFNSSAQDKSARSLDSYVRGKVGEDRYLRPGNTLCYLAIEFTSREKSEPLTVGVCIEASPQAPTQRSFFIVDAPCQKGLFFSEGYPRSRRELKIYFRNLKKSARIFDHVNEYQHEMLKALGGLPERFFDLFLRALTFQPLRDVRAFVEQWLLAPAPLDLETLQRVAERLGDLRLQAQTVSEQISLLSEVQAQQDEALRFKSLARDYESARDLAKLESARQNLADTDEQKHRAAQELEGLQAQLANLRAQVQTLQRTQLDLRYALETSDVGRRKAELLTQKKALETQVSAHAARAAKERNALIRAQESLKSELDDKLTLQLQTHLENEPLPTTHPLTLAHSAELKKVGIQILSVVDERLRTVLDEVAVHRSDLKTKQASLETIERHLDEYRQGGKARLPAHIESYRTKMQDALGVQVPLLCELLEVVETRWQDAVEGVLGPRRYQLLVDDATFELGARTALALRSRGQGAEVGLLDVSRVLREGRQATRGSLATRVATEHAGARAYVDSVLGDVMLAESERDLRKHRRAITPQCLLYSEWSVRAMALNRIRPWQIGKAAESSQLAALEDTKKASSLQLGVLHSTLTKLEARADALRIGADTLSFLRQTDATEGIPDAPGALAKVLVELAALNDASLQEVEKALANSTRELAAAQEKEQALAVESGRQDARFATLQESRSQQQAQCALFEEAWGRFENDQPEAAGRARSLLASRSTGTTLSAVVRNLETSARGYETRHANELQKLTGLATSYNVRFQFSADPSRLDETRYRDERLRLESTALPEFAGRIDEEQRKAEHELREHILHRLREQILQARSQLERVNQALKGLEFHNESYRFRWSVADDFREHYALLEETKGLGSGALLESDFYRKNKVSFDRFFETLTQTPQNEQERALQARITDYRAYLDYDIEVCNTNGQVSRLSRIIGQTSGGETQTPFYLTIAASFLQLYSPRGDVRTRETPRIVAFDEAFSKMDQERIASTLELFHKFGLQIITATPLERCEYLVPKMRTSLVLTAVGDNVLVEPYRNYLSSLSEAVEEFGDSHE